MEPTGRLQLKEVTRKTRPSEPDTATRAATDSSGERGHLPAPKQPDGGGADPRRPHGLADHTREMHLPLGSDGNGGAPTSAPPQQPQPADGGAGLFQPPAASLSSAHDHTGLMATLLRRGDPAAAASALSAEWLRNSRANATDTGRTTIPPPTPAGFASALASAVQHSQPDGGRLRQLDYLDVQPASHPAPAAVPVTLPCNQADIRAYLPTVTGARGNLSEGVHEVPADNTGHTGTFSPASAPALAAAPRRPDPTLLAGADHPPPPTGATVSLTPHSLSPPPSSTTAAPSDDVITMAGQADSVHGARDPAHGASVQLGETDAGWEHPVTTPSQRRSELLPRPRQRPTRYTPGMSPGMSKLQQSANSSSLEYLDLTTSDISRSAAGTATTMGSFISTRSTESSSAGTSSASYQPPSNTTESSLLSTSSLTASESLLNPTPVQTHSAPQYDTEVQYHGGQQYNGGLQFGGGLQFSGGQQHSIDPRLSGTDTGKLSSATAGTSSLATSESLLSPATVQAHRAPQYEASQSTDPIEVDLDLTTADTALPLHTWLSQAVTTLDAKGEVFFTFAQANGIVHSGSVTRVACVGTAGAGKTTSIHRMSDHINSVITDVPADMFISMSYSPEAAACALEQLQPGEQLDQATLLGKALSMENTVACQVLESMWHRVHDTTAPQHCHFILVCDRTGLDGHAFCDAPTFQAAMLCNKTTVPALLARYKALFFFRLPLEDEYPGAVIAGSTAERKETWQQARQIQDKMLLGPLLQHRDLTMIGRQPDMNIKVLSALTALAQHVNVDAGAALQPYVETLAAQVIVSTSHQISLGQDSIFCSGQLDQAQEPSFCLSISPVDPIQLTIFRLAHDMCTHYRRQFTEFEDNTAPQYRAMVHSAWTSMMESSLRLFNGTQYTKILEFADAQFLDIIKMLDGLIAPTSFMYMSDTGLWVEILVDRGDIVPKPVTVTIENASADNIGSPLAGTPLSYAAWVIYFERPLVPIKPLPETYLQTLETDSFKASELLMADLIDDLENLGYLESLRYDLPTMRVVEGPHGLVKLEPALVQSVRCYRGRTPFQEVSSLSGVIHRIPDTEDLLPIVSIAVVFSGRIALLTQPLGDTVALQDMPVQMVECKISPREPALLSAVEDIFQSQTGLQLSGLRSEPDHVTVVTSDRGKHYIYAVELQPSHPFDISPSEAPILTVSPHATNALKFYNSSQLDDHVTRASGTTGTAAPSHAALAACSEHFQTLMVAARDGFGGGKVICTGQIKRIHDQFVPALFDVQPAVPDGPVPTARSPDLSAIHFETPGVRAPSNTGLDGTFPMATATLDTSAPDTGVDIRQVLEQMARNDQRHQEQLQLLTANVAKREADLAAQIQQLRHESAQLAENTSRIGGIQGFQLTGELPDGRHTSPRQLLNGGNERTMPGVSSAPHGRTPLKTPRTTTDVVVVATIGDSSWAIKQNSGSAIGPIMCTYSEIAGDLDSRLLQKDEATEFCFLHEVSIIGSTSTSVPPFSMQVRNDMPETVLLATVSDMLSKQWNVTISPADSSSPHQIFDTVSIVPGTDSMAPDTIFLYVNMSILNVANHYQSQAASGEDPWLWLHTSSPPCSNLYDQRFQLALDKAVLLHRTDLLRQYTSWKSQSMTAQSSTASAPENSQLNTTLASLNVAVSTMSSIFTKRSSSKIRYTPKEIKDKAVQLLEGVRYSPFTGRRDQPAAVWIEDVSRLVNQGILLHGCDEAEKPAWLWDILLRSVSDKVPPDHSRSPRSYLKFKRTEQLKNGHHADKFPDFETIATWLTTEFTSEDACETLVAEFLALRPTHMDAQKFLGKAAEYLQRVRDTEAASAIQQPFEQRDPRPIFKFFMDIVDHYERMYKEVILPAYKKRLVGPDIHKAPPTFELKAMFMRMAAVWEAENAQKRFDRSPGQSTNTSVSFHANTVVTTDKIDLKYTTFENMSAYLVKVLHDNDCGPTHLCGARHMSWMTYFLSTTLVKQDREYVVSTQAGTGTSTADSTAPAENTLDQKRANTAAREALKTKAASAFGGLQGYVFLAFMYAMYDWLVNGIKPVARYATFWRNHEKVCSACGSHDHMCLDCSILNDNQHPLGRAKNYAVPPDPNSTTAKRAGRYFFFRTMSAYRPENRTRVTGGIDTAPDVRSALHATAGTASKHILDPHKDTSLPKTYDNISDTPLQSRPFLLERVQNVAASDLNPDGTLRNRSGAMEVRGSAGSKAIYKDHFVGEIVTQLSGKVRVENGTQIGTVFELGTARAKHPSIDYELEIRQLTGFPVVYDAEAVLEGYSNPGHFRYSSSRNQRGVVSVAPVVPAATDSPASHTNTTPVGSGQPNGSRAGRMVRKSGLVQMLAIASIVSCGQAQNIDPTHGLVNTSDSAVTLTDCCTLHNQWKSLDMSLNQGSADWTHIHRERGKWHGYKPCCVESFMNQSLASATTNTPVQMNDDGLHLCRCCQQAGKQTSYGYIATHRLIPTPIGLGLDALETSAIRIQHWWRRLQQHGPRSGHMSPDHSVDADAAPAACHLRSDMDYSCLAAALHPARCDQRNSQHQRKPKPATRSGPSEHHDSSYQRFLDQTTVCAPLTLRPTSATTASIDATDSGLIVDEWNAPNGRRKYSLGIDTYCGCVAVMTKSVAEQHWNVDPTTLVHTERIRDASGGNMKVYGKFCGATIFINQIPMKLDFIVADLDIGCDLLLGQPLLKHYKAQINTEQGVCIMQINGEPITVGQGVDRRKRSTSTTFAGAIDSIVSGDTECVRDFGKFLQTPDQLASNGERRQAIADYQNLALARCVAPGTACTEATWQRTQARALAAMCRCHAGHLPATASNSIQTALPTASYNRTMRNKKPHPSILKVTRIDNSTDPVVSPCATIQLQSAEAAHPNPKRSYVPPHFPEPKPPRNPAQAWGSTHEWCCQLYAQLQAKQQFSTQVTAINNFSTMVQNLRNPDHTWWGALDKPVEQRAKDRLANTETSSLREFFMETALSDKYNRQSRESPFRVQFAPTVADGARPTNSTKTTVAPAVNATYADQHVPTVPEILKTLGMDENGKFAITDPDADARIIRDYLADNNTFVKRSDLAAVLKTDDTIGHQLNPHHDSTLSGIYDLAAMTDEDAQHISSDLRDNFRRYTEHDHSVAGLVWHHDPVNNDSYITVDLPTFLDHDSHQELADVTYKPGTTRTRPVAAASALPYLRTKPDTPAQKPPPQSDNYVPPPDAAQRARLGLSHLLDSDGLPLLHVTDELKEFVNKSDPALQHIHGFIAAQGVNYSTDSTGLPDSSVVMKPGEPTEFEKVHAMRVPLQPGKVMPKPAYRKMSRADLEIAAATIRAFAAQGWIYKCKSPTMAPIHLVHKEPKAGIDPESITPDCPEGKPFPARRRFTIDFSQCNAVFQVEAARIPDVKETIQSMRIVAGESQRQFNANKSGTRTSIHDHDPAAAWNITSDRLPPPDDYLIGSCDLVHAFHQMHVHEPDQWKLAFGNNVLGCWCWSRGAQGASGTPSCWCNFVHASLAKHGVLFCPDFHVSDLEKHDFLDFDTDDNGEFVLDNNGQRIPSPQGYARCYTDDISIISANATEHERAWRHLVKVLKHVRLNISPEKTKIGVKYLTFLGHCVSPDVTFANLSKVEGMQNIAGPDMNNPWSKTDVRSWCGAVSFYRCYIPDFATMARPLHQLTHDDVKPDSNITKHWTTRLKTDDPDYETHNVTLDGNRILATFDSDRNRRELTCQEGFEQSKSALCKLALCRQPDFDKEIVICVDSSQYGMGSVAASEVNGKLVPLEYYSANHTPAARRYSSSEREALALVCATTHFAPLISGSRWKCRVLTDHSGLTSLLKPSKKMNSVRLAGWAAKLQNVTTHSGEFRVEYSSGSSRAIASGADTLSRLLDPDTDTASDDWNTVNYRDFPPIKMIYDQLDREMDSRGRIIGAITGHSNLTDTNSTANPDLLHETYYPDNIFYADGYRIPGLSDVHPSLLSTSAALHNTDTQFVAAVNPASSTPATPTVVDRTKIIFQRPDGKILLMRRKSGGVALPTWHHDWRPDIDSGTQCALPADIASLFQSQPGDGFQFSTTAVRSHNHTAYRVCHTPQWNLLAAAFPTGTTWVEIDELPLDVVLEDLQYLRVDPSIFPQYNDVTELCPLVKAWGHERTRRNRSGIHVVAGMRPNKIAKGVHSVTQSGDLAHTFMAAENDTISLISKVPSVRKLMQQLAPSTTTTDKHYAQTLSTWNARLGNSSTSRTLPWNQTFPKGGTVVYLTPTGETDATHTPSDVDLHRLNLVQHASANTVVTADDYLSSPYWRIYTESPRIGSMPATMATRLHVIDCQRVLARDAPSQYRDVLLDLASTAVQRCTHPI